MTSADVSLLEWVLILEGVVLGAMVVLGLVGRFIAKTHPDDPFAVFCRSFWHAVVHPPLVLKGVDEQFGPRRKPGEAGADSDEDAEPDAPTRVPASKKKKAPTGPTSSTLSLYVVPNAGQDAVTGRFAEGLQVEVRGDVTAASTNKIIVELIATALGVEPFRVTVTKGHYQPRKGVAIQNMSPEALAAAVARF